MVDFRLNYDTKKPTPPPHTHFLGLAKPTVNRINYLQRSGEEEEEAAAEQRASAVLTEASQLQLA